MVAIGLVFSTLLELSLTGVAGIASPIAFALLAFIGVLLLAYGVFFGFIVLPCNPGFIGAFFSKQLALSVGDFGLNVLNSVIFAIGIGTPLLLLAVAGAALGRSIVRVLTRYKSPINRVAGAAMLGISIYHLVAVFQVPQLLFRSLSA